MMNAKCKRKNNPSSVFAKSTPQKLRRTLTMIQNESVLPERDNPSSAFAKGYAPTSPYLQFSKKTSLLKGEELLRKVDVTTPSLRATPSKRGITSAFGQMRSTSFQFVSQAGCLRYFVQAAATIKSGKSPSSVFAKGYAPTSPYLLFSKKTSPLEGEEFLRKVMMSTGGCYA
jgi:hypothetical protein